MDEEITHRQYFAEKNRKLEAQFSDKVYEDGGSHILKGVSIFCTGYTKPSHEELKSIVYRHGGQYQQYFSTKLVTHVIAEKVAENKARQWRASPSFPPVVTPTWLLESVSSGRRLPTAPFIVPAMRERGQRLLGTDKAAPRVIDEGEESTAGPEAQPSENGSSDIDLNSVISEEDEEYQLATMLIESDGEEFNEHDPHHPHPLPLASDAPTAPTHTTSRTSRDPGFVAQYFARSRLHFIGSFKRRLQLRAIRKPPVIPSPAVPRECRMYMHVDMDAFFCSVSLRDRPELQESPVAVCHGSGNGSEVASFNYPARKYGVRAGMWLGSARRLCPDLVAVPYDFEQYEKVSAQIFDIFHEISGGKLDMSSVDEAYLDISHHIAAGESPDSVASRVRRRIMEDTRCTASAGIAHNLMLAKVATGLCKPNGQRVIARHEVREVLASLPFHQIPGIGWRSCRRLEGMQIKTCADFSKIPVGRLKEMFGENQGTKLHEFSLGRDCRELKLSDEDRMPKTIGAEVNWGIRFENHEQVKRFLSDLADEVSKRLRGVGAVGTSVVLKLMQRKSNASTPTKFMGHGSCDTFSKTEQLGTPTDDATQIARAALVLWGQFSIEPSELRGVGIQLGQVSLRSSQVAQSLTDMFSGLSKKQRSREGDEDLRPLSAAVVSKEPETRSTGVSDLPPDYGTSGNSHFQGETIRVSQIDQEVFEALPSPIRQEVELELRRQLQAKIDSGAMPDPCPRSSDEEDESNIMFNKTRKSKATHQAPGRQCEPMASLDFGPSQMDQSVFDSLPMDIQREYLAAFEQQRRKQRRLNPLEDPAPIDLTSPTPDHSPQHTQHTQCTQHTHFTTLRPGLRTLMRTKERMASEAEGGEGVGEGQTQNTSTVSVEWIVTEYARQCVRAGECSDMQLLLRFLRREARQNSIWTKVFMNTLEYVQTYAVGRFGVFLAI